MFWLQCGYAYEDVALAVFTFTSFKEFWVKGGFFGIG